MTNDIQKIIDHIITAEGGFIDHPADRGGPTKYGITRERLKAWRNETVIRSDIENLTEVEARVIYTALYIIEPGFLKIDDKNLQIQLIDTGVYKGVPWTIRRLQEITGVRRVDGILGPITAAAVNRADPGVVAVLFACRVVRKLARIVAADIKRRLPADQWGQATFLVGWIDRATGWLLIDERAP